MCPEPQGGCVGGFIMGGSGVGVGVVVVVVGGDGDDG
jgi:hypothetical protein